MKHNILKLSIYGTVCAIYTAAFLFGKVFFNRTDNGVNGRRNDQIDEKLGNKVQSGAADDEKIHNRLSVRTEVCQIGA